MLIDLSDPDDCVRVSGRELSFVLRVISASKQCVLM